LSRRQILAVAEDVLRRGPAKAIVIAVVRAPG
jgi:hypothetical protein